MFEAALGAADPTNLVAGALPSPPKGRTLVVGAGKAAASMARAVEAAWPGPLEGVVVTRYGHGAPTKHIRVVEAGHPVPDEAGQKAAAEILALAKTLGPDDLMLTLISGGGSALLACPPPSVSLADKQALSRALLQSGADIGEMNCVRKHLSRVKGGRLALACHPARIATLAISDVPGDALETIASGPTVGDATTREDALRVLAKYGIDQPASALAFLRMPESETPKPGDPRLAGATTRLVARPQDSLEAAATVARAAGYAPLILGDAIEGEAREVARVLGATALQVVRHGQPLPPRCVLLSGGETTVTVRGGGRGGRNVEFLLALACALRGQAGVHAIAADTDGIDGAGPAAGALIGPDTWARARHRGIDAAAMLADNDAHAFFECLGDAVVTGPTHTNVNDFRAILVDAET